MGNFVPFVVRDLFISITRKLRTEHQHQDIFAQNYFVRERKMYSAFSDFFFNDRVIVLEKNVQCLWTAYSNI